MNKLEKINAGSYACMHFLINIKKLGVDHCDDMQIRHRICKSSEHASSACECVQGSATRATSFPSV